MDIITQGPTFYTCSLFKEEKRWLLNCDITSKKQIGTRGDYGVGKGGEEQSSSATHDNLE